MSAAIALPKFSLETLACWLPFVLPLGQHLALDLHRRASQWWSRGPSQGMASIAGMSRHARRKAVDAAWRRRIPMGLATMSAPGERRHLSAGRVGGFSPQADIQRYGLFDHLVSRRGGSRRHIQGTARPGGTFSARKISAETDARRWEIFALSRFPLSRRRRLRRPIHLGDPSM
jgi:hypothetical protein